MRRRGARICWVPCWRLPARPVLPATSCWVSAASAISAAVAALDAHDWLLLVALAVLCMFLPTVFQAGAISRIGAERGALASTIGPPAALLLGVLMLGERPDIWQLIGTAIIVVGIVLIAREHR